MSWFSPLAQGVMAGAEAGMSYAASSASAKAQEKWQTYKNKMVGFISGEQQDDVTTNLSLAEVASGNQNFMIQKQELEAEGTARVNAAAAGVSGNSVDATMQDIARNAANQQDQRIQQMTTQQMAADKEKRSIVINAQNSMDYSSITQPSLITTGLSMLSKDMQISNHYEENGYFADLRKSLLG